MGQITLKQITKNFGNVEVIQPIDLTVEDGEFVVFVGPSGCGKSTLLRLIAGLEDVTSGQILIDGKDATNIPPARRGLAMVFQSYALYPHMSVRKNIGFPLKMARIDKAEANRKIEAAAEVLNLTDYLKRRPGQLSGGQRQRIAIARALVDDPRILIFDEATSALDYESESAIQENMKEICEGRTVIIIAHRLSTVRDADRILTIEKGVVVEDGNHAELLKNGGRYADLYSHQNRGDS